MGTFVRNVIVVGVRKLAEGEDISFDRVWKRYKAGNEAYRNRRLKYLPRLSVAPWLLTKAIDILGGQRPVIMGNGYLAQSQFTGDNYVEIDVDISSSAVARSVASSCLTYCTSLTIDEAFVVESQVEDELPERILYAIRFNKVDIDKFTRSLRDEDYDGDGLPGWTGSAALPEGEDLTKAASAAGSSPGGRERVGSDDLGDFDDIDDD